MDQDQLILTTVGDLELNRRALLVKIAELEARIKELEKTEEG